MRHGDTARRGGEESIKAYKSADAEREGWVRVAGMDCFIVRRDCNTKRRDSQVRTNIGERVIGAER